MKFFEETAMEHITRHFPVTDDKFLKFIDDEALLKSRYMIIQKEVGPVRLSMVIDAGSKLHSCYCTYCKVTHYLHVSWRHKSVQLCPSCGSNTVVIHKRFLSKYFSDRVNIFYYHKSVVDPSIVVGYMASVLRDFTKDYKNPLDLICVEAYYIFDHGKYSFYKHGYEYRRDSHGNGKCVSGFHLRSSLFEACKDAASSPVVVGVSSLLEAVKGTKLEHTMLPFFAVTFPAIDPCISIGFAEKHPQVEYLAKLGFKNLSLNLIRGYTDKTHFNWKGKTFEDFAGCSLQDYDKLCGDRSIDDADMFSYVAALKCLTREEFDRFLSLSYYSRHSLLRCQDAALLFRYLLKQTKKCGYVDVEATFSDYRDFQRMYVDLKFDTSLEIFSRPRNLQLRHDIIVQLKLKDDGEKAHRLLLEHKKEFLKLYPKYVKRFSFSYDDLMVVVPRSPKDIVYEGQILQHCVGGYVSSYLTGKTVILFIREISAPKKPFFTLEVRDNRFIQCQSTRHELPDDRVMNFLAAFASKLKVKPLRRSVA